MKIKCPICKGEGEINAPSLRHKRMAAKTVIAQNLKDEGYSFREIMRIMGYKSTRSVGVLLETKT